MIDDERLDNAALGAETLDEATLRRLGELRHDPLVSMYLPTRRAGADTRENPIRFKNRLADAERQLEARGWNEDDADAFLAEAHALVDDYDYWQHQLDGLAVFVGPDGIDTHRLPVPFDELTVVADRLHLKPLLPVVTEDGRFWALAVSLNRARLYEGTHFSVREVDLGDTPTSLAEALRFDEFEKYRGQQDVSRAGQGHAAVAFGTDDTDERRKIDIGRFFQGLDRGVRERLGTSHAPLVFEGVDYLFPLYREANHYDALVDEPVEGNPDTWDGAEVHARAWKVVRPRLERAREDAKERLHEMAGTGQASADLGEALLAAHDGRVDTLFVALGRQRWGRFDEAERRVETHDEPQPSSVDLLDMAAVQTVRNGGRVYALPPDDVPQLRLDPEPSAPSTSGIAAIFRY